MKPYRFFFILFFIFAFQAASLAQYVSGKVKTESGLAIPYASVFVPALHHGTTANEKGEFILPLPPGNHELVVQYLGFQSLKHKIEMKDQAIQLDVVLTMQEYMLPEVIVTSGGEDPAFYVMRKAIGMSQYYRNQISYFKARVYLKGSGMATHIPALLVKRFKKEGIETGKTYVTETISEIISRKDSPLETKVLSMRSSLPGGDSEPMQFFTSSLYNESHGAISPLSKDAFNVYRFKLEGTFPENDHTIFKIRVLPKRKGTDLYDGSIFIREGSWSLHSAQLALSQKMVSVVIRQQYQQISPQVWMPVSHDYDVAASIMGIDFRFRYLASLSDYKIGLNPNLDHAFYARFDENESLPETLSTESRVIKSETIVTNNPSEANKARIDALMTSNSLSNKEMRELNRLIRMEGVEKGAKPQLEIKQRLLQIDDSARIRKSDFWQKERTVPLLEEEKDSFGEADSLRPKIAGADSLAQSLPIWLLMGEKPKEISNRLSISYNGLLGNDALEFNTVDGFSLIQAVGFNIKGKNQGFFTDLNLKAGYAFARKKMLGELSYIRQFAPMHRGKFTVVAGSHSCDFNGDYPMLNAINSINSLMFKTNRAKYYGENAIAAHLDYDLINGLQTHVSAKYAIRNKLENNSSYFFANFYNRDYTKNIPDGLAAGDSLSLENAKVWQLKAGLSYTPMQYYRIVNGRKQIMHSVWPTFGVMLNTTFTGRDSQSATSHLVVFSLQQTFSSRLWGRLEYKMQAGAFLGDEVLHFADRMHFNIKNTHVGTYQNIDSFRRLGNYEASTAQNFASFHAAYSHSRILIKRLPFLSESLLRESVFVNHLILKGRNITELGYGLNQLFLVFNAEVYGAFEGGRFREVGLRIGIPFDMAIIEM